MEVEQKTCIVYVDYEGLLVSLSRVQYFNIDDVLSNLLAKAQERFLVQRAIVLGDWTYHQGRRQLERQGFLCRTVAASGSEIDQMLQSSIAESLATHNAVHTYILVSGTSDYNSTLRFLRKANRESILWTLIPPSSSDQALCSLWESIILPPTEIEAGPWSRQMMLQAIAMAADHLQGDSDTPFLMSRLHAHLAQLDPFHGRVDTWLAIASREQILLLQQPENPLDEPYGYLNRQLAIVRKALFIRERILVTLGAMLVNREWVAFSAIEKGLCTARLLADSQQARHAWLELFVAEGVFIAEHISQPDGVFQVTTLRFNLEHPLITTLQRQQRHNLIRLIITISDFTARRGYPWMAVASLLKCLTGTITRIEARATLSAAEQQNIIETGSLPGKQNPALPVTTVKLQQQHALVQETLTRRDQLIAFTSSILTSRNTGVSESVLTEEFVARGQLQKSEALFWIGLLTDERVFSVEPPPSGAGDAAPMIKLAEQDPLVDHVLALTSDYSREVKE
jgi:hypothetical protein